MELAAKRKLSLIETVKLFLLQGGAVFDSALACWAAKRFYDSPRPITVLQCLKRNQTVKAWKGPYLGVGEILGDDWTPYQDKYFVTPSFPEYVSGHSTFSSSSAEVLKRYFRSDYFNFSTTIGAGQSMFEPKITAGKPGYIANVTDVPNQGPGTVGYVPANNVTLSWLTFTEAANEAGISRLYGGIHIPSGNSEGQILGKKIAEKVWNKYISLTT
eukprot:TRINITY_DN3185_c0_g2_i2.p1 TRINITY_DN3185_c0_g2~~TRINITY_DN3185_c0_g2_i2.p1  ORF type:complete len:215 (-),score=45.09 TRINITY_DN3185_c0_g2_i2:106-750(-)